MPVDNKGKIIHPVNTDDIILDICNNKLGLALNLNDIGRSHVIGKARNGKAQVIARFLSYRSRQLVYSRKKTLKNDPEGIFITENLTQFRANLTKKLAELKFNGMIHAYWTTDGPIYVKESENGRKLPVLNFDDISIIERRAEVCASIRNKQQAAPETVQNNPEDNGSA